ncbi:hypothetical protein ACSHWD_07950 [Aerococcus urinaeequi]|uniref:hypothetical protein n=1 Tax=Aerococcus urinaeequi TaxID=51665 RepID=UPI003B4E0849
MTHLRHEAEKLDDWVRYEAEYKGRYAHQLTEAIENCKTDGELKDIIVSSILDRYGFYYTKDSKKGKPNRPTKETKKMLELLNNNDFKFDSSSSRNNMLNQTLNYIQKNSGLFPLLWKADAIWGYGTYKELLEWLGDQYYSSFEPNDDHISWVNKYKNLYLVEGKPWEEED